MTLVLLNLLIGLFASRSGRLDLDEVLLFFAGSFSYCSLL